MRKIVSLLLLSLLTASIAAHATVAQRVSVAELEQILAAAQSQSDGRVAKRLSGLKLTERVNSARLAHWEARFPGKRCTEQFTTLADASAFLNLPAADIPATAPPDLDTKKTILSRSIDYVNNTIKRLPDFYATRRTENFAELPSRSKVQQATLPSWVGSRSNLAPGPTPVDPSNEQLLATGKSSSPISYVDGSEVLGSKQGGGDNAGVPLTALTTHGEFGPILVSVLLDAVKGRIYWGHWEQGANGAIAVFRYSVPLGQTSYLVALPRGIQTQKLFPAYHGEFAIDPDSGAILRITVIADLSSPNENAISSILVEYAPVLIGGKSYICPVHGVALARFIFGDPMATAVLYQTQLNDVAFLDYHQFRAESRLLFGSDVDTAEPSPTHK
jgi:hypothetical protein